MAQKVKIILEDDLEGGPAEETVRFGLDGGSFEIDLSAENAAKLREAVRPFVAKARRVQAKSTGRAAKGTGSSSQPRNPETAKIRKWAQDNGYKVSDRGRIHQDIQDKYYAAMKADNS